MVKKQGTAIDFYLQIIRSLLSLIFLMILTGLLYPLLLTGIAQFCFPLNANGNVFMQNQKRVGFELIGQPFENPSYFWGRPSATIPYPYNTRHSKASNLGPTNPELLKIIEKRIEILKSRDPQAHSQQPHTPQSHNPKNYTPEHHAPIPIELLTSSGSGLDPHISPQAALYQIPRIAAVRKISKESLKSLVEVAIEKRQFKVFGEPKINVLRLNLALDKLNSDNPDKEILDNTIPTHTRK